MGFEAIDFANLGTGLRVRVTQSKSAAPSLLDLGGEVKETLFPRTPIIFQLFVDRTIPNP